MKTLIILIALSLLLINTSLGTTFPDPNISGVYPPVNSVNIPGDAIIKIDLAGNIIFADGDIPGCVRIHGSQSGSIKAAVKKDQEKKIVMVYPVKLFFPGERISVTLTPDFGLLINKKFVQLNWNFTVSTKPSDSKFGLLSSSRTTEGRLCALAPGDIDNDGDIDLIAAYKYPDHPVRIFTLFNNGTGHFDISPEYQDLTTLYWGEKILLADYDNDGDVDIAFTGYSNADHMYQLRTYVNDANGSFTFHQQLDHGGGFYPANRDFDSDGDMDILAGNEEVPGLGSNLASKNRGNAEFDRTVLFWSNCGGGCVFNTIHSYMGFLVDDYDSDCNVDFIVKGSVFDWALGTTCYYLNLYKSLPGGGYSQHGLTFIGTNKLTAANDLDGDRHPDFISSPDILYLNNNLTFTVRLFPGLGGEYTTADFDGDGDIDILESSQARSQIRVLANDGFANFTVVSESHASIAGTVINTADFDNDGDMDVALESMYPGYISVYENLNCVTSACSITGPEVIEAGSSQVMFVSDKKVGHWTISNSGTANATIVSSPKDDSVYIDPGSVEGKCVLRFNTYGNCGGSYCEKQVIINSVRSISENKFPYYKNSEPKEFALSQNHPNPFNPVTVIRFEIPVMSDVSLKIFDASGRMILNPVNTNLAPGSYSVSIDGTGLSSGIYFCTLHAGNFTQTNRMILLK